MAEASAGKDSVTGHWEMMGIVLERPFPTFPAGFPADVIAEFERRIGRGTIGNVVASGTEIIQRLDPSTSAPGNQLSTPRRTASSRSPRTKTSFRLPSYTESVRLPSTWLAAVASAV